MEEYFVIKFPTKVTSSFFYKKLLPSIQKFKEHGCYESQRILFDFGEVEIVNALVIPNLLMLGHQLRVLYDQSPLMFIPTRADLLKYLDEINFLTYSRRFSIFKIFEEYIGDYRTQYTNARKTYYVRKDSDESQIWALFNESNEILEEAYDNNYDYYRNETALNIRKSLWEICKNSVVHGESFAFITIQKEKGINKVMIAESDTGKGIYESLKCKIMKKPEEEQLHFLSNKKFISLKKNVDREIFAIIEAAFFRRDKEYYIKNDMELKYGLWDIIYATLRQDKDGKVRIHSNNMQVIFTNRFLNEYFPEYVLERIYTTKEDIESGNLDKYDSREFFQIIEKIKKTMYINAFHNIYNGVHIEVEVRV